VADVATVRNGKGAQQLRKNLRRVVPKASDAELDELVGESLRSYARYWLETFRLPKMDPRAVAANAEANTTGAEHIDEATRAGKGFILALPHMGNWDHAGAWAVGQYKAFTTVAERLKPERLFERFVAYRESIGMEVLPLTGGPNTFLGLVRRLKSGGLVCLVAERDLTDRGVPVEFLGETTKLPAGPAALAVATGAALMPVTLWYEPDNQRAIVHDAIPVPAEGTREQKIAAMCQSLADVFAKGIAEHPADWHMLQKLWLSDLDPAKAPRQRE